jgi:transcription initiation factor TFIID subunit 8
MSYQVYPPPDPSRHYQSHYGPPAAQHHSVQLPKPPSVPHRLPPPPPDFASVTPQIASQTVQRLISSQLRDAGYEAAQPQALRRLEIEVAACEHAILPRSYSLVSDPLMRCLVVELLYGRAHEYANLANRAGPIATDLLLASEGCGMQTRDLHKLGAKSSKKRKRGRSSDSLPKKKCSLMNHDLKIFRTSGSHFASSSIALTLAGAVAFRR